MAPAPIWHGTPDESDRLLAAIDHNCSCQYGKAGERTRTCSAHQMMLQSQRAMDGLLWMSREVERLKEEENQG